MSDKESPLGAAIKAFRQRQAEFARTSSEQRRAQQEQARQQEADLTAWSTSASNAISLGVMQVNEKCARHDSPFIIRQRPDGRPSTATFEVHRSEQLDREAVLTFALHADGLVRAETDARGADLPDGIAVGAVTPQWAEETAEQVMLAALGGQGIPNPDDNGADFMKGGFQTYVPVQPRSGRRRR